MHYLDSDKISGVYLVDGGGSGQWMAILVYHDHLAPRALFGRMKTRYFEISSLVKNGALCLSVGDCIEMAVNWGERSKAPV